MPKMDICTGGNLVPRFSLRPVDGLKREPGNEVARGGGGGGGGGGGVG